MTDTLKRALEALAAIGALAPGWAADGGTGLAVVHQQQDVHQHRATRTVVPEGQPAAVPIRESLLARIRGQERMAQVAVDQTETCWHCRGTAKCPCCLCGGWDAARNWAAGPCGPCHGTGRLAWPATVQ